jgi:hypothetical protein
MTDQPNQPEQPENGNAPVRRPNDRPLPRYPNRPARTVNPPGGWYQDGAPPPHHSYSPYNSAQPRYARSNKPEPAGDWDRAWVGVLAEIGAVIGGFMLAALLQSPIPVPLSFAAAPIVFGIRGSKRALPASLITMLCLFVAPFILCFGALALFSIGH